MGLQLSIVFAQYDRERHPRALPGLLDTLDRLTSADPFVAVVDNARPGDWTHRDAEGVVHVGGDGWAREFSAFERGLSVLESMGRRTDVFALVTDSVLAYGENILDFVDDQALACCHRLQACVGWVDTWGEGCEIADLGFPAWLRTCCVLVPAAVLPLIRPLAADLEPLSLFEEGPAEPFSPEARISDKVRQCLVEWLTTEKVRSPHLRWHWHSRFDLTPVTRPFFQAKASAILREQLLSARLQQANVPSYGLRCVRRLSDRGDLEGFLRAGGDADYQWLGGLSVEEAVGAARLAPTADQASSRISASREETPPFLLEADPNELRSREAVAYFRRKVLPLIRQRFSDASFRVAGQGPPEVAAARESRPRIVIRLGAAPRRAAPSSANGSKPLATLSLESGNGGPVHEVPVHDGSAPGIAQLCCQLLEDW